MVVNGEVEREFRFSIREFDFLRRVAHRSTGIQIPDEKFNMLYSRLSRRVRKLGLPDFQTYCDLVRSDANEVLHLVNAITTNLTSFFRENHHFELLARRILPSLAAASAGPLRIWSAGCSTGEEPYSIAMTLLESLPAFRLASGTILATDIDSNVLASAATGVYAADSVRHLDPERLRRWFLRGKGAHGGAVRVKPEVRRLVDFGRLNLMEPWDVGPPMDLIFCRNVIIYFSKVDKARLVNQFADQLRPGGHLFIGHSESLFRVSDRYELLGHTLYRKRY